VTLPYENATAGEKALMELQKILASFGCQSFGTMTDQERCVQIVAFRWRDKQVNLEASWKGYATAWLKVHPYTGSMPRTRDQHDQRALAQARISVCSVLRDWVKGQVTAVECGIMSFEEAFMPHMLTSNGQRLIDRVRSANLLTAPEASA